MLVGVVEAGGEPVELERLLDLAALVQEVGEDVVVQGRAGRRGDGLSEQPHRLRVPARVGAQLLGVLAPEIGAAPPRREREVADLAEAVLAAHEVPQAAHALVGEARLVGEERGELVEGRETRGIIAVVVGEGDARAQGNPALRGAGLEGLAGLRRGVAILGGERAERLVLELVELGLREREPLEQGGALPGDERHPARAGGAVAGEEALRLDLDLAALVRVAQEQRSPAPVVADDRLEVPARDLARAEREGHSAVEQRHRCFPGDGEGARDPAVALEPVALHVVGGAAVADLLGQREVVDGLVPEG